MPSEPLTSADLVDLFGEESDEEAPPEHVGQAPIDALDAIAENMYSGEGPAGTGSDGEPEVPESDEEDEEAHLPTIRVGNRILRVWGDPLNIASVELLYACFAGIRGPSPVYPAHSLRVFSSGANTRPVAFLEKGGGGGCCFLSTSLPPAVCIGITTREMKGGREGVNKRIANARRHVPDHGRMSTAITPGTRQ
jgi:hypothetical protein